MTCGFKNSAGTDLDSLFYTDNKNSGPLGFVQSNGVDLGNKYTSAATLGYSVGFKNKAGTDIGYLRGDMPPPQVISANCTWHQYGSETTDLGGASGTGACVWGYFDFTGRGNTPTGTWEVFPCFTCTYCKDRSVYYPNVSLKYVSGSSVAIGPYDTWGPVSMGVIGGLPEKNLIHSLIHTSETMVPRLGQVVFGMTIGHGRASVLTKLQGRYP